MPSRWAVILQFDVKSHEKVSTQIHPDREATVQCILCLRSRAEVRKSFHCTPECLQRHWPQHRQLHEQRRVNGEQQLAHSCIGHCQVFTVAAVPKCSLISCHASRGSCMLASRCDLCCHRARKWLCGGSEQGQSDSHSWRGNLDRGQHACAYSCSAETRTIACQH